MLTALQNEQASSRALLGPTFRQNMTLYTLSSLYLAVLARRELHSSIISLSTFKPPPRVTLPDQRREAWLSDLANPFISLRRLSRTIPHGIKGPALLEQCSSKNIPMARAVWFVRCVGANELRGLKRKGVGSLAVGGEVKWIKEWTVQVIQFLERTLAPCDPTVHSWLKNVHYS
jgi:mediator of RNA polymerase II transcription subunit 12